MPTKKTTKRKSTRKKPLSLPERTQAFVADEKKLLEKHQLYKEIVVMFPYARKVPFLGKLALKLLKRSRGVIQARFKDKHYHG